MREEQQRRDALVREREERRQRGEKVRGREPKAVEKKINPKAQYNFTDPESRIMKTRGGFDQCYNAQAAEGETAKERMQRRLSSKEGRSLYGLRKQTVEPAFGIIKGGMRFRQCLMRGVEKASAEWNLVCSCYNVKRLFNLLNTGAENGWSGLNKKPA